jgi:bifunctional non-homologous end joining protein LigD
MVGLLMGPATTGKLAQNAEAIKGDVFGPIVAENYVTEPKFDGWRILAFRGSHSVEFYSRSGKSYSNQLPHIAAEIMEHFPFGTWLDGEVCAYSEDHGGTITDKWHTVQSVLTTQGGHKDAEKVSYMVFDLIAHGGIDARPLGFGRRRGLLERIFDGADFNAVKLTPQAPATIDAHEFNVKRGFEGSVIKRLDAPYASDKRGAGWTKVKPVATIDAVVMDFEPGKNGFTGMVGAVVFGQYDDNGKLIQRGKCSGMDMKTRKSMTANPSAWKGTVIEVAHEGVNIGESESGRFRFPRFKRMRDDKNASECTFHDA